MKPNYSAVPLSIPPQRIMTTDEAHYDVWTEVYYEPITGGYNVRRIHIERILRTKPGLHKKSILYKNSRGCTKSA